MPQLSVAMQPKMRGFTLIELVVVIVLLGITSITLAKLISYSVSGYVDTTNRQDSVAVARIALDRMGRELREAMPQSVRVSSDQACVQFLPVITSFFYTAVSSVNVSAIEPPGGYAPPSGTFYAAIYPLNADELYSLSSMKSLSSFGAVTNGIRKLTLGSAFVSPYPHNGSGQRVYIVGLPVSYCFETSGVLNRYVSTVTAIQPAAASMSGSALLVNHIAYASSTFTNSAATWQNNALIKIVMVVQSNNGETLSLDHEVWIRNAQ